MRPCFSESSRRAISVTVRGFVCSPSCPAIFFWRRFTRRSKGAITRTRRVWGMPRRSHCPPRLSRITLSRSANS